MTHPTKAVHKFMMQDYVRMGCAKRNKCLCTVYLTSSFSSSSSDALFSPLDMSMSLASIIPISAHQLITICPGVSFTPYHAGHVLGACMFLIDIAGLKILYTGDYSRRKIDILSKPSCRPFARCSDCWKYLWCPKFGKREEKEERFTSLVHSIIRREGHVLLPSFALGRAQELLLILDEYWKKHPDLHNVPIYYASSLARKCMAVYQTYIHTMNSNIRHDSPNETTRLFSSACLSSYAFLFFITSPGMYLMCHKPVAGRRKLLKVLLVLCLPVLDSCKLVQAVNYLNCGLQIRGMVSLSLDTLSREHQPGWVAQPVVRL